MYSTLIAQAVSSAFAPATVSVTSPKSVSRGRTMQWVVRSPRPHRITPQGVNLFSWTFSTVLRAEQYNKHFFAQLKGKLRITCARHHRWQIRQPAVLSKLRSSAQGLLRLLSAMTAKSISEVKPSNKMGAHHLAIGFHQWRWGYHCCNSF